LDKLTIDEAINTLVCYCVWNSFQVRMVLNVFKDKATFKQQINAK